MAALFMLPLDKAWPEVFSGNPKNYRRLLKQLSPGDTLYLQPGTYRRNLPIHHLNGKENQAIMVTGPAGGRHAIFTGNEGANTISILNSSYVQIRNLEINGQGEKVDAVKAEGHSHWAHHITLEHLFIHGYGSHQQLVGISTKCPAWGWIIRHNTIIGAGTGIYLGNSDGRKPFINGLIEHNLIADTLGYNLQIKHQIERPHLPDLSTQSATTVIRHNVFSKAHNASSEGMARPNVLAGHWPLSGEGSEDTYLIYGNVFYQNPHEALFQGEGNVALYDNLFINTHRNDFPAIAIQPHNDIPRRITIFHNTVVTPGTGIAVRRGDETYQQEVVANAVFADLALQGGTQHANITDSFEAANQYLARPFEPLGKLDLYPKQGKLKAHPLDMTPLQRFLDGNQDFNGKTRTGHFRGAYRGEGKNPGWQPVLEIKPSHGFPFFER